MPTNFPPAEFGFVRVAACVPEHRVAHVDFNTQKTIELAQQAAEQGARIAVFPELGLTSYTAADLFYQSHLLDEAKRAPNTSPQHYSITAFWRSSASPSNWMAASSTAPPRSTVDTSSASSPKVIYQPRKSITRSAGSPPRSASNPHTF